MAMLLKGADAARALTEQLREQAEELKKNGTEPCLAILRVGAREDDLSYERGALKRCEKVGITVRQVVLPEDAGQQELMDNIRSLNEDERVHGVLMFRPLPKHLDDEAARRALDPRKDMDGITDGSLAAVYAGTDGGYPPCTAAACVALLKHYNVPIKGKRVVVIGRSLVIGKPVSLLLLAEHATVTICHSRSENLPAICREADILVVAAGKAGMVGAESVRAGQIVLDVGIHVGADGNLCGDTRFAEVELSKTEGSSKNGGAESAAVFHCARSVIYCLHSKRRANEYAKIHQTKSCLRRSEGPLLRHDALRDAARRLARPLRAHLPLSR